MPAYLTAYIGSALAMLVLDVIWLTTMVPVIYKPALGDMLADPPISPWLPSSTSSTSSASSCSR